MQQNVKPEEISREDLLQALISLELPGIPPLQHPALAHLLHTGSKHLYFAFRQHEQLMAFAIIMLRRGVFADLYFGPVRVDEAASDLPFIELLKKLLRRRGAMVLRIFPPPGFHHTEGLPGKLNWATMVIDISRSEEDILRSFSPNHRQSITKAIKAGISVVELGADDTQLYTQGYLEMFARRGFQKNVNEEQEKICGLLRHAANHPQEAFALGARLDGNLIGGGIFLISGNTCFYYQGFAARLNPQQPVLHLILWRAMQKARHSGCTHFDLYGYSLDGKDAQLTAINDFKKWFRGELIIYPKTLVIPLWQPLSWLLRLSGKRF